MSGKEDAPEIVVDSDVAVPTSNGQGVSFAAGPASSSLNAQLDMRRKAV